MRASGKPVVARVNGGVAGGGNGLVAAADMAIAAESATFAFSEVLVGVAPAIISVVCLPRMRELDALELFLTGDRFSATRGAELGLITRAVPDEQLDVVVSEMVAKLRRGARRSAELFNSAEAAEGMAAFAERRSASWAVAS
jgi:methylglutaconyl-CoA hydratase